jgi:photosystem II stability/assembly factor-like uncharacterized protein
MPNEMSSERQTILTAVTDRRLEFGQFVAAVCDRRATGAAARMLRLTPTAVIDRRYRKTSAAFAVALFFFALLAHGAEATPRMLLLDGASLGDEIVVVGERGTILHSPDQARTWREVASPVKATLTAVGFAPDAPQGWAVGHDGVILATADAGRTWARQYQSPSLQDSFLDVIAIDAQRVIAVGAYGLFVETNDGGKTWMRRKLREDDYHFNRLTRGPSGTLYLAGEHGTLLRSPDAGATWAAIPAPYEGSFYGILPLGPRELLAYGLRGHVFRSVDDGAAWEAVATPHPVLLATAVRAKKGFVVVAGQSRGFLLSHDEGKNFTPFPDAPGAAVLPDGNILALGEAGATLVEAPK